MSSVSLPAPPVNRPTETGSTTIRLEAALIMRIGRRNGPSFVLDPHRENTLGRSADAGIVIPDRLASRGHATLQRDPQDGRWQVRDLGSRNGTWVDGRRVDEATLEPGMTLRIGTTELIFRTFSRRSNDSWVDRSEQIVRCGPVGEVEGHAFQRVGTGSSDDNRRAMLLYQMSIQLLASRSIDDVIAAAVELAAEQTGVDAVGWFEVGRADSLAPRLVVPADGDLALRVNASACHQLSQDGQAVWIAKSGVDQQPDAAFDLACVPVLDEERPWAAICATACHGRLRDSDFDFLVALASLASAACAGHRTEANAAPPSIGLSLATVETIDATPEQFRSMAEATGTLPEPLRASELLGDSLRLDDWQQLLVREALRRAEGRVPDAAEALGISRATLYRKLDQYGLSREEFSRDTADESGDDEFSPDGL
jgi:hypothetical protein